jgi:hypothetical protein
MNSQKIASPNEFVLQPAPSADPEGVALPNGEKEKNIDQTKKKEIVKKNLNTEIKKNGKKRLKMQKTN